MFQLLGALSISKTSNVLRKRIVYFYLKEDGSVLGKIELEFFCITTFELPCKTQSGHKSSSSRVDRGGTSKSVKNERVIVRYVISFNLKIWRSTSTQSTVQRSTERLRKKIFCSSGIEDAGVFRIVVATLACFVKCVKYYICNKSNHHVILRLY